MPESLIETVEAHPAIIGALVVGVAILAYMNRGSSAPEAREYTFAGGGAARAIDPNAAAIEMAAISAGQANVSTISQLIGLQDTNSASLAGLRDSNASALNASLAQTESGRQTGLASIGASLRAALFASEVQRDTSLAATSAQRDVSMYGIGAAQETTDRQTDAGVTIASGQTAAQITAAQINAVLAGQSIDAQRYAEKLRSDNENFRIQASKDIARAEANAGIFSSILGFGASFLGALV